MAPPAGYAARVAEICRRHGILLIADEVMAGFGRTGERFAVDHWDVVPDMLTMAKGLTSSYLPLGAVGGKRGRARRHPEGRKSCGAPGRSCGAPHSPPLNGQ